VNLNDLMKTSLKDIKKKWPKNLSSEIINGALFIDNFFLKKNKFYVYINFCFLSNNFLI